MELSLFQLLIAICSFKRCVSLTNFSIKRPISGCCLNSNTAYTNHLLLSAQISSDGKQELNFPDWVDGPPQTIKENDLLPSTHLGTTQSTGAIASSSYLSFRIALYDLIQAGLVGLLTALYVTAFKLSIRAIKSSCYQKLDRFPLPLVRSSLPVFGGCMVSLLLLLGKFPPGLAGTVKETNNEVMGAVRNFRSRVVSQMDFLRKIAAAAFTLGTGCSLGPEGPCVEIGLNAARTCMDVYPKQSKAILNRHNRARLLLSCGAAAGVAAGFNAPIAGVFFAIEILQATFKSIDKEKDESEADNGSLFESSRTVAPLLLASVLSTLLARSFLGDHLIMHLKDYNLGSPLLELPFYLALGVLSGFVAFSFSHTAKWSKSFFNGDSGPQIVRKMLKRMPTFLKPFAGGILNGLVAIKVPEILFFGHETIDPLLAGSISPTFSLIGLLAAKIIMTAISAGSGLVGGTFAPALFLGAMTGAIFHNFVGSFAIMTLADIPAYTMVGSASVLAALFRAPMTAAILLFESTRDYNVILPIMASAGIGSVIDDILENKFENSKERKKRRDQDSVSWGDLADEAVPN